MTYVSCSTWWIVRCFVRPKFAFLANTPSWTVCVWITVQTTGLQRVGVGRTQERMRIRRLCPPRSQILLHHVVPSYSCFPGYCASQRPLLLPPLVYLKVWRTESAVLPTPGRVSHCKEIIFWSSSLESHWGFKLLHTISDPSGDLKNLKKRRRKTTTTTPAYQFLVWILQTDCKREFPAGQD